ncbi:hypothetical protein EIP91_001966 [Steccherinum ochraceum]|uniref:Aquaporin n=1 Tax=Steccherinum ochraceum TaxID=92696 RepID=A0A4R0RTS6_9APHY|nr:hypothetical protein EIP91_001966 [Steccherinum ochraceum]
MSRGRSLFSNFRSDILAAALEFVGTTFFLTLAFGGVQAVTAEANAGGGGSVVDRDMKIALSFGFSLLVAAWLFYRVTGGLFNPQVSLALLLTGVIEPMRFVLFVIAELTGGIAAAALVLALTPGPLQANTFLVHGINPAQGVFIEAFITFALCLAVLMLAAEKSIVTPFAPVGIGLTLFVCHLFAVYFTGAGMNSARSFGPAAVTGFPHGTQWVTMFTRSQARHRPFSVYPRGDDSFEYWKLNAGQDDTDSSQSPSDPVKKVGGGSNATGDNAANGEKSAGSEV